MLDTHCERASALERNKVCNIGLKDVERIVFMKSVFSIFIFHKAIQPFNKAEQLRKEFPLI